MTVHFWLWLSRFNSTAGDYSGFLVSKKSLSFTLSGTCETQCMTVWIRGEGGMEYDIMSGTEGKMHRRVTDKQIHKTKTTEAQDCERKRYMANQREEYTTFLHFAYHGVVVVNQVSAHDEQLPRLQRSALCKRTHQRCCQILRRALIGRSLVLSFNCYKMREH